MSDQFKSIAIPAGPVVVTRVVHFCAAHRRHNPEEAADWNTETFGLCNNPQWHGHNYELFVTVKGTPDPVTGFVIDVKKLSDTIKEVIKEKVDHSNLNLDVEFIPKGMQPTTENLAIQFWKQLEPHIQGCELHCIKLCETENIFVEYYGE